MTDQLRETAQAPFTTTRPRGDSARPKPARKPASTDFW